MQETPINFASPRQQQTKNVKQAKTYFSSGKILAKKGEWKKAIAAYRQAIDREQNFTDAYHFLGDALVEIGEKEEAIKVYRRAVEMQPELWEVHHKLGNLLQGKEELEEAVAAYHKSIELKSDFCWSYNNLGDVLVKLENWEEAVRAYHQAVEFNPDFHWGYYRLGDVLVKLENWEEAVAAYHKSIELKSDFCWSYNNLGDVLVKLEKWEEAARAYGLAVEFNPDFPWGYYKLGDVLVKLKDWEGTINAYLKAINLQPELVGIHTKLADALHYQKRIKLEKLVNLYRHKIEKEPDNIQNHYKILEIIPDDYRVNLQLAKVWERKGDFSQAIVFCKNAIAINSKEVEGHLFLANILVKQQNFEGAIFSYRRAIEIFPNKWEYHQQLSELLKKIGRQDEAIITHQKAIQIQSNPLDIKQNLAKLFPEKTQQKNQKKQEIKLNSAQKYRELGDRLLKEGKLEESANNYRQALELKHNFWQVHHSLGDALQKQGKLDDAVACYCQAININPNFFWSPYNLGNTLIRQGNLDQAIASYFYAAEIQPYKIDVYEKLANLLQRQGHVDEAKEYKLLVKKFTNNPVETCCNLADKLALEGKIEGAISCYQRALELKQDLWKVYGKLGNLLKKKGDLEAEIKLYNRVLKLNQKLPEIEANLQEALKEQEKTKRVKKVEGIPDDFVIPSIVGEGNDYSFIEEKVQEFVNSRKPYKLPVSIIIPTYNRKEILAKTLAAITHQTYPKHLIEIIVADDGSTDGVEEIILKYEKYLELIHVRQQDRGYRLCAVRNLGIRTSKHEHLILLDCDLIPEPQFVEELMKYLHVTDKAVLMAHRRFVNTDEITDDEIFEDINAALELQDVVTENIFYKNNQKNNASVDWRFGLYEKTNFLKEERYPFRAFASGHVAYPKKVVIDGGFYDEDFQQWGCEDIEFGYRVYNSGYYFIPVLTAIDLHQEPPGGVNETNRVIGNQITRKLLEQKCPAAIFRDYKIGEIYEVPKVSIYIPAYNVEKYIQESVDSALNQTYTDIEICICNDGSTDGTLKVLEENYSENPRVRWVTQANGKILKARQTAISMCRGLYIAQLDADDILKPDAVEIMVNYLDKSDVGCVYSNMELIDEEGNYLGPGYNWPTFSREKLLTDMIVHHFRMFRRKDWMRTEGFSKEVFTSEDYDMFLKLSEVCSFHKIDNVLYSYRKHPKNSSIINMKKHEVNRHHRTKALERMGLADEWEVYYVDFEKNPRNIGYRRKIKS
ncbi:MAG: tetratricopeptide repeat protein [Cyanobacteriota bacterium]|nr:tetratricopeptide repeat protein [Cyanobacteriota bacterium]